MDEVIRYVVIVLMRAGIPESEARAAAPKIAAELVKGGSRG